MTDFRLRGGARLLGSARDGRRGRRSAIAGRLERDPGRRPVPTAGLLRVVVADEHPPPDADVTTALNAEAGFDLVGEAAPGGDLLSVTRSAEPDVVLFVARSPRNDRLACLSRLCASCPHVNVIVYSPSAELDHIQMAFRIGVCGFVTAEPADLAAAVRRVVEGTAYRASRAPAIDRS